MSRPSPQGPQFGVAQHTRNSRHAGLPSREPAGPARARGLIAGALDQRWWQSPGQYGLRQNIWNVNKSTCRQTKKSPPKVRTRATTRFETLPWNCGLNADACQSASSGGPKLPPAASTTGPAYKAGRRFQHGGCAAKISRYQNIHHRTACITLGRHDIRLKPGYRIKHGDNMLDERRSEYSG